MFMRAHDLKKIMTHTDKLFIRNTAIFHKKIRMVSFDFTGTLIYVENLILVNV